MKKKGLLTLIMNAAIVLGGLTFSGASAPAVFADAPPNQTTRVVDVKVFYQELAPLGRWFTLGRYGNVWTPYGVASDWRPYTDGHWEYTDCGWTWVSDDDWGWATDHYGRWFFDSSYGWVWVPDTTWGPAWVDWQYGDGWIGWAPLTPFDTWGPGGLAYGGYAIPAFYYSFVREDVFVKDRIKRYIERPDQNQTILRITKRVTDYTYINGYLVNRSVSKNRIERVIGHSIDTRRVEDVQHNPVGILDRQTRKEQRRLAEQQDIAAQEAQKADKRQTAEQADAARQAEKEARRQQRANQDIVVQQQQQTERQAAKEQRRQQQTNQDIVVQQQQQAAEAQRQAMKEQRRQQEAQQQAMQEAQRQAMKSQRRQQEAQQQQLMQQQMQQQMQQRAAQQQALIEQQRMQRQMERQQQQMMNRQPMTFPTAPAMGSNGGKHRG